MSYIIIFITAIAMFTGYYKFGFDGASLFSVAFIGVFLALVRQYVLKTKLRFMQYSDIVI